uniref:Uncharacterized protein n=1 Tax=Nicotiana tabacum TaxID=4097 RepID=A0A1S4AE53_TOBAC|nr:PREDICTED: uncharacterized protein LOC107796632 [Nicotiana tabacum]
MDLPQLCHPGGGCCVCNLNPTPDYSYYLSDDDDLPEDHRLALEQIWFNYHHQTEESNGFEFVDCPGPTVPITPYLDFKFHNDYGVLIELANCAIQEYNEKECNVCMPLYILALCDFKSPSP